MIFPRLVFRLLAGSFVRTAVVRCCALVLLSGAAGCFSLKEPPCAFTCVEPPHRCPENYTCLADGLCHREGVAAAVCGLTPPNDAGTIDLGTPDGGRDATATGDAAAESADSASGSD